MKLKAKKLSLQKKQALNEQVRNQYYRRIRRK